MYKNESEVARAISDYLKNTGSDRSSVFITTKWNPPEGLKEPGVLTDKVYEELQASRKIFLEDYDLEYVDLMLVHQSRPGPIGRANHWKALVKAQADGWIKDIGVSNQYVNLVGCDLAQFSVTKPTWRTYLPQDPLSTKSKSTPGCNKSPSPTTVSKTISALWHSALWYEPTQSSLKIRWLFVWEKSMGRTGLKSFYGGLCRKGKMRPVTLS
jgi:hypothetical protein